MNDEKSVDNYLNSLKDSEDNSYDFVPSNNNLEEKTNRYADSLENGEDNKAIAQYESEKIITCRRYRLYKHGKL